MNKFNRPVQGLAEISLRVHDLDAMRRFYEEVIGLEILQKFDESQGKSVFYTIGAGNESQNMALFEDWMHARMFYFNDPEGNLIEFKSYDETVQ